MKKAAFSLAAIFAFFLAAELICRIAFPGITGNLPFWKFDNPHLNQPTIYVHDPVLFWKLKPGNPGYNVNDQGFRGPAVSPEKQKGEFRVICLGDSCTFGVGPTPVLSDQTYAAQLQKLLREALPDRTVNVLNFGCPGYTSFQGKMLLKKIAPEYKPDVVTAYFGINDAFPAQGFADADQRPMVQPPAALGPLRSFLKHLAVYEAMVRSIYGARLKVQSPGVAQERVPMEDYHKNLDAIKAQGASQGIVCYFIDPPYLNDSGEITRSDANMHEPRIDIYTPLKAANEQGLQPIFGPPDNIHPTPEGHRLIAQCIFEKLMQTKPWQNK